MEEVRIALQVQRIYKGQARLFSPESEGYTVWPRHRKS